MSDDLDAFERELSERPGPRRRAGGGGSQPSAGGGSEPSGGGSRGGVLFLIGLVLGVAGALLVPIFLGPYLPAFLRGNEEEVTGVVADKRSDQDRLLLTVRTERGAVLATFSRRVPEIDLLVSAGDTVVLGLGTYEPFVENPDLRGVRKAEAPAAGRQEGEGVGGPAAEPPTADTQARPPAADTAPPPESDTARPPATDTMPPIPPDTGSAGATW